MLLFKNEIVRDLRCTTAAHVLLPKFRTVGYGVKSTMRCCSSNSEHFITSHVYRTFIFMLRFTWPHVTSSNSGVKT